MAIDFPTSPTTGQQFAGPDGVIWSWDGAKWISASPGTTIGYGNVGRNLIHNSMFNVAQRGLGPFTSSARTLDRWALALLGSDVASMSRQPLADDNRTSIGDEAATHCLSNSFTGSAVAGSYQSVSQAIEGIRRLAGKTVVVSFYANAGAALKLGINLLQHFGTGGSPSAGVWALATGQSVTLSGTFARYSVTVAIPSIIGKTIGTNGDDYNSLAFWYSSSSGTNALAGNIGVQSGAVNLWGVQLEIGSVATPLEKPDPQIDLLNCKRFYLIGGFQLNTYQAAGTAIAYQIPYPVPMRAAPTLVPNFTTQSNCTGGAVGAGTTGLFVSSNATALGAVIFAGSYTASADL